MTSFAPLAGALSDRGVRYLLIEVSGVNLHAHRAGVVFTTQDRDLFLPRDAPNLLRAWQACEQCGLELISSGEPLDRPRDLLLAERVVQVAALTNATDGEGLQADLTLVMTGFDFDEVWHERAVFELAGVEVPVARLKHIVASKANAGRDKDRLFLATHAAALKELLTPDEG
jgi:predicted nucleotidyltransferase